MLTIARFGLAFVVGVATFYFVFWVPFSLVSFLPGHFLLATVGSLAAGVWTARYTWRRTEDARDGGVLAMMFGGALVVGAVGFVGGSSRGRSRSSSVGPAASSTASSAARATPTRSRSALLHHGHGLLLGKAEQIDGAIGCNGAFASRHERRFIAHFDAEIAGRLDEPGVAGQHQRPGLGDDNFGLSRLRGGAEQREPLVATGLDDGPIAHERHRTP
jgi:hypothetical protein